MKNKIFLIEKHNYSSKLKLFLNFQKKTDLVHFFKSYQLLDNNYYENNEKKQFQINIKNFDQEEITFNANKITLDYLKNLDLSKNLYFKFLYKEVNSYKIELAVKKSIKESLAKKIRFYLIYMYLKDNYPDHLIVPIEDSLDEFKIKKILNIKLRNSYLNIFYHSLVSFLFSLIYIPFYILIKLINSGLHIKRKKINNFLIGQHIINGFNTNFDKNFKKSRLDNQLYKQFNDKIKKKFTFIFSIWNFSIQEKKQFINYLKEKNINYIFENDNSINLLFFFKRILLIYIKFMLFNFYNLLLNKNNYTLNIATNRLLVNILDIENFHNHYCVKIFFARDDFSSRHIIRTIVLNKNNCYHYGFQHSAFLHPYIDPTLTYTYFNKYYLCGKNYLEELYKDFWLSDKFKIVGQPYLDFIFDTKNYINVKDKFYSIFGKDSYNALIAIPTVKISTPFENIKKIKLKYKNIWKILENNSNLNIIFRCRSLKDNIAFKKILSIPEKYKKNVFFITHEFNTYELAYFSDVIIGNDTSSLMLELIGFEKKLIIPYNVRFENKKNLIWYQNNYEYLCDNVSEISLLISKYINKLISPSINKIKVEIRDGYSHPFDGKTWQRVSENMLEDIKHIQ